jgi:hypothetical protein
MINLHLKQGAFTPVEVERLKGAYDRIVDVIGRDAPVGLKEAVASEIMDQAAKMTPVDELEIIARVKIALRLDSSADRQAP